MVKKIFFQFIFFNFFLIREVFAAESGGMPQLNPEFWISQIFWLTVTFGILYLILSKIILPKISSNLELRKSEVEENIEVEEKQRESSKAKLKEYDDIIQKSKLKAKSIFRDAGEKVIKDINSKFALIFGSNSFDKTTYKIPKVSISQNICEIQNSGFN